jgi:hypothetical protein
MSLQHTVTRMYGDTSSNVSSQVEKVIDDTEHNFDGQVAAAGTNVLITFALTRASLKSLLLYSDQAVTIYTNNPSGSSPQDTILLVAGQAKVWTLQTDLLSACPFSGNITALYITNPGGSVANIKVRAMAHQHS